MNITFLNNIGGTSWWNKSSKTMIPYGNERLNFPFDHAYGKLLQRTHEMAIRLQTTTKFSKQIHSQK